MESIDKVLLPENENSSDERNIVSLWEAMTISANTWLDKVQHTVDAPIFCQVLKLMAAFQRKINASPSSPASAIIEVYYSFRKLFVQHELLMMGLNQFLPSSIKIVMDDNGVHILKDVSYLKNMIHLKAGDLIFWIPDFCASPLQSTVVAVNPNKKDSTLTLEDGCTLHGDTEVMLVDSNLKMPINRYNLVESSITLPPNLTPSAWLQHSASKC